MRAADRDGTPAYLILADALLRAWWFPTIVLAIGGFARRVVGIRVRL